MVLRRPDGPSEEAVDGPAEEGVGPPSPWPPECDLFEPKPKDPQELAARCAGGRFIADPWVDALLPEEVRHASLLHFTPAAIALRGAQLLTAWGARRVLDVGAGAGKFCALVSLASELEVVGVEYRPQLVEVAKGLLRTLRCRRARILGGDALALDWSAFDALYFYNPFAEPDHPRGSWIDQTQSFDSTHSWRATRAALEKLEPLAAGTLVLTYHGLGAQLPPSFEYLASEQHRAGALELLRKLP